MFEAIETGHSIRAPAAPRARLSLGITGHRSAHPAYEAQRLAIEATLAKVFNLVDKALAESHAAASTQPAQVRLHSLLTDGADQLAANQALVRGWDLAGVLPLGRLLYTAINAAPAAADHSRAVLAGLPAEDPQVQARVAAINHLIDQASVLELADADEALTRDFLTTLDAPQDTRQLDGFRADCSARVALAGRLIIEHSDLMIAIWDGQRTSLVGGTGHTVAVALDLGAPVLWINPVDPAQWRILSGPESLALRHDSADTRSREALLQQIVLAAVTAGVMPGGESAQTVLSARHWRPHSNRLTHAYRWIERRFGGQSTATSLTQTYETPAQVVRGSGASIAAALAALPDGDPAFGCRVVESVMARFVWADGIGAHLSDSYRSSMVVNFLLSAAAVISGVAYLPLVDSRWKWPFATFELLLLAAILLITALGQRRRWHSRWFQTRRVAEYLRHAPLLLSLGAARAPGRWLRGSDTNWPEHYARQALREAGLPTVRVTHAYLRAVLTSLIAPHVASQRSYHEAKARRLAAVHHRLDHLSERAFQLAVAAAVLYLLAAATTAAGLLSLHALTLLTKPFTLLGVALPTFGGCLAGIRYFGDFERFSAISRVTASKLQAVDSRIAVLLAAPDPQLDYAAVAELAHTADDIVSSEIANWQAVFEAKQITVPA